MTTTGYFITKNICFYEEQLGFAPISGADTDKWLA